ncbi:hypothetical protein [Amycolatopsis sp. NPDC051071]|uniref:hypothetical protein n=1 Tax=Amycolatopsis sp. NPDC051071 TaxID=3154637 RepID=UPI0034186764
MSRRFFIAIGVGTYRDSGIADLPGAPGDADRVRRLFADLGYREALPDLASVFGRDIPHRIETWAHEVSLDADGQLVIAPREAATTHTTPMERRTKPHRLGAKTFPFNP